MTGLKRRLYPYFTPAEKVALHARMKAGDTFAREDLARSCIPRAMSYAKICKHVRDPDERFGECMLAIAKTVDTWEPAKGALQTHLKSKVRSRISNAYRNQQAQKRSGKRKNLSANIPAKDDLEELIESEARESRAKMLHDAIARLSERQRDAIQGTLAGKTFVEIARDLGISRECVRQHHVKGCERLKELLEGRIQCD